MTKEYLEFTQEEIENALSTLIEVICLILVLTVVVLEFMRVERFILKKKVLLLILL